MQDLGVPVDSVSLALRTVNMEYHTARSKQVSFVSALWARVIRRNARCIGFAGDAGLLENFCLLLLGRQSRLETTSLDSF